VSDAGAEDLGLFGEIYTSAAVAREVNDHAWLQALLDTEAALARAQATAGLMSPDIAAEIGAVCRAERFSVAGIGRRAVDSGNPVIPLVHDLRAAVGPACRGQVHRGATSQDILDTAMMLIARRALAHVLEDLAAVAASCARLADTHRDTLIAARTLMQQAAPTTFGLTVAGWLVAVDEVRDQLTRVRGERLAIQLGGAVGTLAALGDAGPAVAAALAEELQLALPTLPWHTNRVRVAQLAAALGTACGALGKIATDVILLAQTEVAEVCESSDGGGSSSMPQKSNPVRAILTAAAARRAPGLVATLLGAMVQEHERAAGAWHAEWATLTELVAITGGAAAHTKSLLDGMAIDPERMEAHVAGNDMLMAAAVAGRLAGALGGETAHDVVRRCAAAARARGTSLRAALMDEPRVTEVLSMEELDVALDPRAHLGSAAQLIDAALRAYRDTPGLRSR
jgi:3-carboxy-cis,cis-muconate cycloisomerase